MQQQLVFIDNRLSKYSWAHVVISITEASQVSMQCCVRDQRAFSCGSQPCPLCTGTWLSETFDDIHHKEWNTLRGWKSLQSLIEESRYYTVGLFADAFLFGKVTNSTHPCSFFGGSVYTQAWFHHLFWLFLNIAHCFSTGIRQCRERGEWRG